MLIHLSVFNIVVLKLVNFFLTRPSWFVPKLFHMFSKVHWWTPFSRFIKFIFVELPQKIKYLMKRHILIWLIRKIKNVAILLKFPTLRCNIVNRASKTKVKKSCHSTLLFIRYWRKQSRILSAKISEITWKNGTHESIGKFIICKIF